jgi:hypothetical protein
MQARTLTTMGMATSGVLAGPGPSLEWPDRPENASRDQEWKGSGPREGSETGKAG